jgi:hypothetical protein
MLRLIVLLFYVLRTVEYAGKLETAPHQSGTALLDLLLYILF